MSGAASKSTDELDDLELLDELKEIVYNAIKKNEQPPKVGELLKIIEMKSKLSVSGKAEKKFWDMINKIREQGLAEKTKSAKNKNSRKK